MQSNLAYHTLTVLISITGEHRGSHRALNSHGDISDPYSFVHERQTNHDLDQFR